MVTGQYVYDYPRAMVTVDIVCFRGFGDPGQVGLIRRRGEPFAGQWALPGGFVGIDEDLGDSARRELTEETGLEVETVYQFGCFGRPGRDPRGRTISVAFLAFVGEHAVGRAGDDAAAFAWCSLDDLPSLAFDHNQIISKSVETIADWRRLGRIDLNGTRI